MTNGPCLLSGCRSLWRAVCPGLGLLILLCTLSACASNTGIFGGGKWQTGALQSEQLQVLAVDPNHLQHLYAGDARDGVFVSMDTGQTWQGSSRGLPLPLAIKALAFDTQGERLFAATSHGLFVSADVAGHWSQVPAIPAGVWTALTFDANAPRVVYAASAAQGIFKSSDLGGHWTPVGRGLPTGIVASLAYDPNLKQLWAAFAGALYRSDDGGASWHAMNSGLPTAANINVISQGIVTDVNRSLLFVGTDQGFFRSTDAGQHWRQSQFSLAHLHIRDVLADASQPGVVYVSTNIGVLRSNDNGQNWDQVASGLPTDRGFAALAQGGPGYTQLLVAARGIYLYPGSSAGTFNASRVVPALLILLFFLALYYFFSLRRRPRTRPLAPLDSHPLSDQQGQNGHRPASGQAPGAQTNERQEQ